MDLPSSVWRAIPAAVVAVLWRMPGVRTSLVFKVGAGVGGDCGPVGVLGAGEFPGRGTCEDVDAGGGMAERGGWDCGCGTWSQLELTGHG